MKEKTKLNTKKMVLTAMLFGTAIVLSIVEGMLPMPVPVPGVKFGLSNIVVMYALFFIDRKAAFTIAVLKGIFAAMTRGGIAGILSLSGGILSLLAMILVMALRKEKGSYFLYSMTGAVFHNTGQFAAIALLYTNMALAYYFPLLLISGVLSGILTSVLLRFILPALKRLDLK